jgi:hypothetical protein
MTEKEEFVNQTMNTYKALYAELLVRRDIVKKANLWTQERDPFFTSAVQKMDEFTTTGEFVESNLLEPNPEVC